MKLNNKSFLKRTGPIRKKGSRGLAWEKCRKEKVRSDLDEDGLIKCEDWKLDLVRCGIAYPPKQMDLHHSEGRDGDLLTDKSKLVWLTRGCHDEAHDKR